MYITLFSTLDYFICIYTNTTNTTTHPHIPTLAQLPGKREEVVRRVDRAMRLALLRRGGVPSQFTSHIVRNGVLTLAVQGEFEVRDATTK